MHIRLCYPIKKYSTLLRIMYKVVIIMEAPSRVISMMFMLLKTSSNNLTTTVVTPIMHWGWVSLILIILIRPATITTIINRNN